MNIDLVGTLAYVADLNCGLRGMKLWLAEGGIRVPMIARWPGVIPAGAVNDSVVASFDFFPTFAEVAGARVDLLDGRGRWRCVAASAPGRGRRGPWVGSGR